MKALSLIQPWASLLFPFAGRPAMKLHETRSWSTKHRGTIAIHASVSRKRCDHDAYSTILFNLMGYCREKDVLFVTPPRFEDLPRGCIIGIVELLDCQCVDDVKSDPIDSILSNFTPGRYAWRMAKPVLFAKPIPCRGELGLWQVPPAILQGITDQTIDILDQMETNQTWFKKA